MPDAPITLIKGDSIDLDTDYRDALPVNMYAVSKTILGANGYMLCYPGLTSFATGLGVDRGGIYNERLDAHFRISGLRLISVNAAGDVTDIGAVTGTTQAALPYSFNSQGIITDGKMWLYTVAGGLVEVTDADLGSPIDGVWVDGYYFLTDGEYIYHTDAADETSIDPLKFATAEFSPDDTLGVAKTQDNKVMVFGRYSIEYFINAATDDFAFQRVPTRAQKIGIVATHAKCESQGNFYITGGRKEEALGVYLIGVGVAQKVSTREVDKLLAAYTEAELSDMRMECYKEDDVTLVLVHLPNETLCFNETAAATLGPLAAWSILKSDVAGDTPYRAINGVFDPRVAGWIYGDKLTTYIGQLDKTVFTHYGAMGEWLLYSPFLKLEGLSIDELEIETIPGHTSTLDATVAVSFTYDGVAYGAETWVTYGAPAKYSQRFILRRIGYINSWVGLKFRGATKSRMAFGLLRIRYS